MKKFLIGYKCYFSLTNEHNITVEAEDKTEALRKAIELKKKNPQSSIELGGVKWDSFRVIKKLQPGRRV